MPFCPSCRSEYREGVTRCPECDVELVAELPEEELKYVNWKSVRKVPNAMVGNMLKSFLEEEGIEARVRGLTIPWFDGIESSWSESEWGEVVVHEDDFDRAKELVDGYMNSLQEEE